MICYKDETTDRTAKQLSSVSVWHHRDGPIFGTVRLEELEAGRNALCPANVPEFPSSRERLCLRPRGRGAEATHAHARAHGEQRPELGGRGGGRVGDGTPVPSSLAFAGVWLRLLNVSEGEASRGRGGLKKPLVTASRSQERAGSTGRRHGLRPAAGDGVVGLGREVGVHSGLASSVPWRPFPAPGRPGTADSRQRWRSSRGVRVRARVCRPRLATAHPSRAPRRAAHVVTVHGHIPAPPAGCSPSERGARAWGHLSCPGGVPGGGDGRLFPYPSAPGCSAGAHR